eukprot:scaffold28254_cov59-Phaeocystis_antarctica.AAC.6
MACACAACACACARPRGRAGGDRGEPLVEHAYTHSMYICAPLRGAPPQRRVRRAQRRVTRAARRLQDLARGEHAERERGAKGARRRLALRQHGARRVA